MNKPIRAVLIGQADSDFKKLNEIVGQQELEAIADFYYKILESHGQNKIRWARAYKIL